MRPDGISHTSVVLLKSKVGLKSNYFKIIIEILALGCVHIPSVPQNCNILFIELSFVNKYILLRLKISHLKKNCKHSNIVLRILLRSLFFFKSISHINITDRKYAAC